MSRPSHLLLLSFAIFALGSLAALACSGGGDGGSAARDDADLSVVEEGVPADIVVTSSAFVDGEAIPGQHSCYGLDLSPPISWSGAPAGTKSLALVSIEPEAADGDNWIHWLLYGLPPDVTEVPGSIMSTDAQLVGGVHGTNDYRRLGWGGPCPPRGVTHFYFFKVYALDAELNLADGARKIDLIEAMKGHVLSHGQLMGTYHQKDGQGAW